MSTNTNKITALDIPKSKQDHSYTVVEPYTATKLVPDLPTALEKTPAIINNKNNDNNHSDDTNSKKLERILFHLYFYLFSFLNLVMTGLAVYIFLTYNSARVYDITQVTGVLTTMKSVFAKNPINGIQLMSATGNCPSGYVTETLMNWQGTHEGCYCEENNLITAGKCTTFSPENCVTVEAVSPQGFQTWKHMQFCVQRVSNYTLALGNCDTYRQKCGSILCVPINQTCPLIQSNFSMIMSGFLNSSIPKSSKSTFTNSNQTALVDLQIGFDSLCLSGLNLRDNGQTYPLEQIQNANCGKYSSYLEQVVFDVENETDLYTDNNEMGTLSNLPEFTSVLNNSTVSLVGQFQPLVSAYPSCMFVNHADYTSPIQQITYLMIIYGMAAYVGLIVSGVSTFISAILAVYGWYVGRAQFEKDLAVRRVIFMVVTFDVIIFTILTIQRIAADGSMNVFETTFKTLTTGNCFQNPNITIGMKDFWDYVQSGFSGLLAMFQSTWLILATTNFIFTLAFQLYSTCESRKREKSEFEFE
jgi:hypothetical protein